MITVYQNLISELNSLFYFLFVLNNFLRFTRQINNIYFSPIFINTILIALTGLYTTPSVSAGYLISGFIMKKLKITLKKAAIIALCLFMSECLLSLCNFMLTCDTTPIAGLTTSYEGYVVSL